MIMKLRLIEFSTYGTGVDFFAFCVFSERGRERERGNKGESERETREYLVNGHSTEVGS